MALGDVFASKVTNISRKTELTPQDANFISAVADLGARNIVFCLENGTLAAPRDEQQVAGMLAKASRCPRNYQTVTTKLSHSPEANIVSGLRGLTGGNVAVSNDPQLRVHAEEFAAAVMPFFGSMVAENEGGLHVNEYMAGNLQDLLARYEMHEAQAGEQLGN